MDHTPEAKREYMLTAIRRARSQLQSKVYELDEIGVSLRLNMIDAEQAVTWLAFVDADRLINQEPWPTRIEVAA